MGNTPTCYTSTNELLEPGVKVLPRFAGLLKGPCVGAFDNCANTFQKILADFALICTNEQLVNGLVVVLFPVKGCL